MSDTNATARGPFTSPGPVQIVFQVAEQIATEIGLPDVVALHASLQCWADIYYETISAERFQAVKPDIDDTEKVCGAVRKLVAYLGDEESKAANRVRIHLSEIFRARARAQLAIDPELVSATFPELDNILTALDEAAQRADEDTQDWQSWRRDIKSEVRGQPQYPGLRLAIRNMHSFWDRTAHSDPDRNFADYAPDQNGKTPNRATRFVVACASAIDPALEQGTIISHLKKYCIAAKPDGS